MSDHGSSEGLSCLCGDIKGNGNVVQVCLVSILFPPYSPKICWVPRVEATQLNQGSRGGSTKRGECSASRSQLAPSLLKSLLEMRPAPSLGLTLRILSWSLSGPGRGSLTLGGEPSTTAYGGGLVLQLLQFIDHFKDGSSPNPSGMGGKNWGLYLLLIGSSWESCLIGASILGLGLPGRDPLKGILLRGEAVG